MGKSNEMQSVTDFELSEGTFEAAWNRIDQLTPRELINVIREKRKMYPEQSGEEEIPLAQFLLINLCDRYLDNLAKKTRDLESWFVPRRNTRKKYFNTRVEVIKEIYKGILTALKFEDDSPLREDLARFVEPVFLPRLTKSTLKSIIRDACDKYEIQSISNDEAPLHCVVTTQSRLRMTKAQARDNTATQKVKELEKKAAAQEKIIEEQKVTIVSLERDLAEHNERIQKQDASIQTLGNRVDKLTTDIKDKNDKISAQNVQISTLNAQVLQIQGEKNYLQADVNTLKDTVAQLTLQLEKNSTDDEKNADALVNISEENTKLKRQMSELESKQNKSQANLKAELITMMSELQQKYDQRLKEKDDEINALKQRFQPQGRGGYNSEGRQLPRTEPAVGTEYPIRNHPSQAQNQGRAGQVDPNTTNENLRNIPLFQ